MKTILAALLLTICAPLFSQEPAAVKIPADRPYSIKNNAELQELDRLIAPYVQKALKTLPGAKRKFVRGLKHDDEFFVTIRLYDDNGYFEQVFVKVKEWQGTQIKGTIANSLNVVKQYRQYQLIEFPQSDVLDWLITSPDGSEKGNYVGKFLDTLQ